MPQTPEYDDRKSATEAVVAQLVPKTEVTPEVLRGLIDRLDVVEQVERKPGSPLAPSEAPALVGRLRYVIRNDQLLKIGDFLDVLKATSGLIVGLLSVPTPAGIKAVVDGVHGLYTTFSGILRRGVVLPPVDFAVIAALQRLKSATPNAVEQALNGTAGQAIVDAKAVEATLTRYELRGDNQSGFTRRDENGIWRLVGV